MEKETYALSASLAVLLRKTCGCKQMILAQDYFYIVLRNILRIDF